MTDAQVNPHLAQLKFHRAVAEGELRLVLATRDFFLALPETHALGEAATKARLEAVAATGELAPLLGGAIEGLTAQIDQLEKPAVTGEGQANAI